MRGRCDRAGKAEQENRAASALDFLVLKGIGGMRSYGRHGNFSRSQTCIKVKDLQSIALKETLLDAIIAFQGISRDLQINKMQKHPYEESLIREK